MKKGPKIKANASNIINFVPPFTFHHLKRSFKRVCTNKMHEQNKVTGRYLLKDDFGRNMPVMVHKRIAFTALKEFTFKSNPPFLLWC